MLIYFGRPHEGARRASTEGSALITVLIVMLVLTIGALAISAVVLNTTRTLATSADYAKARAAVDAGIAVQTARLESGDLPCAAAADTDVDAAESGGSTYDFSLTCGGGIATLKVDADVAGASTSRQVVYSFDVVAAPPSKEPALVTRAPLNLAALTIKTVDPANPATVWVVPEPGVSGDFSCNSGGSIAGSVFLPAGTVFGAGGCKVKGDVYAEGNITIGSGTTIEGDLVSLNGNVTITGGNTIDGSIFAKGNVTGSGLSGRFVESIHAGGNLSLAGGSPAARDMITYGGTFTYPDSGRDAWAVNSVTKKVVDPPTLPTTPSWDGFTQADLDLLVASHLFTKVTWSGACTSSWDHPMKAIIESFTTPTLVDARACSRVDLPSQWGDLSLKTDVIFVSSSFNLLGQNFKSADGNDHRIWVIVPEDPARVCSTSVPSVNVQGVKMSPANGTSKISGMIFSQCTVYFANAGEDWQGSINAGKMTGNPNFWYKPVGFPGKDDPAEGDEDESPIGVGGLQNLAIISMRDTS